MRPIRCPHCGKVAGFYQLLDIYDIKIEYDEKGQQVGNLGAAKTARKVSLSSKFYCNNCNLPIENAKSIQSDTNQLLMIEI